MGCRQREIKSAIILSFFVLASCTSKQDPQASDEANEEVVAEQAEDGALSDPVLEESSGDAGVTEDGGVTSSEVPSDSATESTGDLFADEGSDPTAESAPPAPSGDDLFGSPDSNPSESETSSTQDTSGSLLADSAGGDQGGAESSQPEMPKVNIPLQKIPTTPFKRSGILLNGVYIARSGDTLKSISQKIYGEPRTRILAKANPRPAQRGVLVGDKIYYNSPLRPDDDQRMILFFEEANAPSQSYVSVEGDNIREVSRQLLGHRESWKEVWSTNPDVESKGELLVGTSLRYWPQTDVSLTQPAESQTPTQQIAAGPPTPEPTAPVIEESSMPPVPPVPPPPPVQEEPLDAQIQRPPDVAQAQTQEQETVIPGSVTPDESGPVGGVSGSQEAEAEAEPSEAVAGILGMDPLVLAGGGLAAVALVVLLVFMKKRRVREETIDFNTSTSTQIE